MTKCLWPHLNRKLLKERANRKIHRDQISALQNIVWTIKDLGLVFYCFYVFFVSKKISKMEREIMSLFNGKVAMPLADKFTFLEIVQKLGYQSPAQILAKPGNPTKLFEANTYYCKPVEGFGSSGIEKFENIHDVQNFIKNIQEQYIVEEGINVVTDLRYVLYTDPDKNNWRTCFIRVRPTVVGNNRDTLWKLIFQSKMPRVSKILVLAHNLRKILSVPSGLMILTKTSVPQEGNYGQIPQTLVEHLDPIILEFVNDLRQHYSHSLPILCFDIVLDTSMEKVTKKNVFFLECQMPFSPISYFKLVKNGFSLMVLFYSMLIKDLFVRVNERLDSI